MHPYHNCTHLPNDHIRGFVEIDSPTRSSVVVHKGAIMHGQFTNIPCGDSASTTASQAGGFYGQVLLATAPDKVAVKKGVLKHRAVWAGWYEKVLRKPKKTTFLPGEHQLMGLLRSIHSLSCPLTSELCPYEDSHLAMEEMKMPPPNIRALFE